MATFAPRVFAANKPILAATGIDSYFSTFPVAAQKDFLRKRGIDFTFRSFDDGGTALDALLTNAAQVGSSSGVTAMVRWDKGGRLYPVGQLSSSGTLYAATVSERIKKPEDLYGKVVSFPPRSSAQYFYEAFLATYKLDGSKIQTRGIPTPESIVALQRGDIDAFFLWEPWNTRAATLVKGARTIAVSRDVGLEFVMYLYFSEDLIRQKALAEDTLAGLMEATDWITKNKEETAEIIHKGFRLPEPDAKRGLNELSFRISMNKEPVLKDFENLAEFSRRNGLIKKAPDWNEFMRPDILKAVAPDRVAGW
ncbi:ABC transporter substrate-binding protein [Xylophilus sp. GOD-11R]|uniref:ABC transporter substrate-binding protein n=1 Tax=Xylophilus sp. GOD-11R TaxID=3089814 RepID=UPI00298CE49E|nr:ABC transporter substrate-binding protein [Xylophilus sp. GOD-11R]WPB59187.1 ABC transporter substrate-binding protein [Xylophilus sp. GOD-11R]